MTRKTRKPRLGTLNHFFGLLEAIAAWGIPRDRIDWSTGRDGVTITIRYGR